MYTIQLPCTEGFLTASDMKILASRLYPDDAMRATTFSSGSTGDVTTVRAALSERLSLLTSEMTISSHTSGNKLLPLGNPASSALSTVREMLSIYAHVSYSLLSVATFPPTVFLPSPCPIYSLCIYVSLILSV